MSISSNPLDWKIGLLGYGEVGRILAEDLRKLDVQVSTFDIKLGTADQTPLLDHAQKHGVDLATSHTDLASSVELLISAVTASQTLAAAKACSVDLRDTLYLDLNSASPGTKCRASESIEHLGGCYLEGAIMTSLPSYRIGVPMLLGGRHAKYQVESLLRLGFAPEVVEGDLGVVSATKMCRSVVIKGLEAILIESLTAARHYGVETAVLDSLNETFPGIDWQQQASYMFSRVILHGKRRTEEMQEAALTVREMGLVPWSAVACKERQAWMAKLGESGCFDNQSGNSIAVNRDWRSAAESILATLPDTTN
jgi:3-hydroxyisobutyrate dehydrogenase-like beta-hydroxyacid dehydrogenase